MFCRQFGAYSERITLYNNQLHALFILSLLNYHTSSCFGHISSPSSGGRMYICGKWYLVYLYIACQLTC
jgi:hypothetical protein